MKKLLIAVGVASALVMTGCATTKTDNPSAPNAEKPMHKKIFKKGKKHGVMTSKYTCDKDAVINATYNPKKETALLNITAPSLGLTGADVTLTSDVTGSGMRFTNKSNPKSLYDWHAKGPDAFLTVTTEDGKAYELTCKGEKPMHDNPEHKSKKHGKKGEPKPDMDMEAPAPVTQ